MNDRIPVTVITGFLGSGKTTLLNRLLRDPGLANAAVVINEFGEVGLDHLLVEAPAENTVLLANGCICCEMRGDLVETLRGLDLKRRAGTLPPFGTVLIETTGIADPVPILQTLMTDREIAPRFRLDSVITLVDAVHGAHQLDTHPEALKQVALADRLLVTKTDLAPAGATALRERLGTLNPGAEVYTVTRGDIDPVMVMAAGVEDAVRSEGIGRWLNAGRYASDHGAGHEGREYAAVDSPIRSFSITHDRPVTQAGLLLWLNLLAGLRGANLLRMKGLLNVDGEPVVVQAVQSLIDEPVTLARWPDDERRSRLVFITRGMERAQIERTLGALGYVGVGAPSAGGAFDAAAYARFVEVAKSFR